MSETLEAPTPSPALLTAIRTYAIQCFEWRIVAFRSEGIGRCIEKAWTVERELRTLAEDDMTTPELQARITAARAVIADYNRSVHENPADALVHVLWAPRLASILADVCDGVEQEAQSE